MMFRDALGRFRLIGYLEGISFLALLFVAMPLKYWADLPEPVTIIGGIHGFLFALYLIAVALMAFIYKWRLIRILGAFVAALAPFGPFYFDRHIRHNP